MILVLLISPLADKAANGWDVPRLPVTIQDITVLVFSARFQLNLMFIDLYFVSERQETGQGSRTIFPN